MITVLVAGNKIMIDREDAHILGRYYLSLVGRGYVRCTLLGAKNRGKSDYLHRLVTGATDGMDVDHINHDKLDNRKNNLRVVTRSTNAHNRKRHPKNYWYDKKRNRFIVEFMVGGVKKTQWHRTEKGAVKCAKARRSELLPTKKKK